MTDERDLFGRTEAELVAAIALQERTYEISIAYRGNEGIAINLARKQANLNVDRRCLAQLLGERLPELPGWRPDLEGAALAKWRKEILSMGYSQRRSK